MQEKQKDDYSMTPLVNRLISEGALKSDSVIRAFCKVKRRNFMLEDFQDESEANIPFPIGHGQTISQPYTVAFMLEKLAARAGDKVLDIGSGSGWQTALLSEIVGPKGKVYGIERILELKEFGERNMEDYGRKNAKMILGDGTRGLKEYAPFDRIIVAAAADKIPQPLKEQLKIGGRLVIPLKDDTIRVLTKRSETEFDEETHPGFVFVPLVKE